MGKGADILHAITIIDKSPPLVQMRGLSELAILKKKEEKKNPIWKSGWTASNVRTKQRENDNILRCIHTIYVYKNANYKFMHGKVRRFCCFAVR